MVQILRTSLLTILGVLCVATSGDAAPDPEPVQQAARGKAPVSQSAPVISGIESTARGYIVSGSGFGSDARAVVINEGSKSVSSRLVRSVTDTKIEVLSKPVERVRITVQVGRTKSRPVDFVYSAEQAGAGQTSKSRPETSGSQQATTNRSGTPNDQVNSTQRKDRPQGQSPTQGQRDRGVPASNPNRGRVTDPEGRSVPVGSQNHMIAITSFSAVPDLASGKRQVRLEFQTEYANATHYRAVQIDRSNQDVPFSGIPWQSYRGGKPVVSSGCGLSVVNDYQVALQVKGPDVPNPNLPSRSMANISAIKYATFSIPESLQSRVTRVLGFAGAGVGGSEIVETRDGYVRLGAQRVGQVASLLVTVANHPGEVNNNMIKSIDRGCFEITAVGPVSAKADGTREFALDGMFDFDRGSCQPKIVIGECGAADERFHSRVFPVRFDRVTTVYTNTVDIASNFTTVEPPDQSGCEGLVERDGDLSFKTESPGPGPMACGLSLKVNFDDAVSEKWKMVFKSGSSGQCGLGTEFMTGLIDFAKDNHPLLRIYSSILNRQSDYHWAYDTLPPFQLGRDDLDKELVPPHYVVQHYCGVAGGSVRTWIDKAIHTEFIRETVNTVRQ